MTSVGRDFLSLSCLPDSGKPRLMNVFPGEPPGDLEYATYSGERFWSGRSCEPFERLKRT